MPKAPQRQPQELDQLLINHREHFGTDPLLISIRDFYYHLYSGFYSGKVHQLCCGKGYLYDGIPLVITSSVFVDDFLIGY